MGDLRVSGEFLTDLARRLLLEDRWEDAMRFLARGLPGLTADQRIAILKGDARLSESQGDGLELIEGNDAIFKAEVARRWAGCYLDAPRQTAWRLYAAVTSFGRDDLNAPSPPRGSDGPTYRFTGEHVPARAMHYADSTGDRLHYANIPGRVPSETDLLFRRVPLPPHWVTLPRTPQGAVDALLAAGLTIEERGDFSAARPSRTRDSQEFLS